MEDFKNRESQYINRRKLTIVSQTPTELVVDITRNEGEIEVAGSPIDATTMNAFNTQINSAVNNASAALLKANEVETTANSAKSIAETASSNASNAVTTANTADTNASSAVTTATAANNTAGQAKTIANTAKTTADQAASDITLLTQRVSTTENNLLNRCVVSVNGSTVSTLNFTSDPQSQITAKADNASLLAEIDARQNLAQQVAGKASQTDLESEIANRENADSLINAKFNNFVGGSVALNNNESTISISTGLTAISTFIPQICIPSASTILRNITIDSITDGTVVINLRNVTTGALEGISNATEIGAKIYWFAMKTFE